VRLRTGFEADKNKSRGKANYEKEGRTYHETVTIDNGWKKLQNERHVNIFLRFKVPTAVTMKNVVFWEIKPSSYITEDTLPLSYRS
jgi:hypothetical protein